MLGLGTSLVKGGKVGRAYVKDGLKLYMPYRGDNTTKGTQFVGTGSTYFVTNDYSDTHSALLCMMNASGLASTTHRIYYAVCYPAI